LLFLFRTFNINQDYILYGTNVPQESGAAETEAVGGAFGMAGLALEAHLLGGADAEGKDHEQADRPEQDEDGEH